MGKSELEDMTRRFVEKMTESSDPDKQMAFLNSISNVFSNALGVFAAHRIIECDCSECRIAADRFLNSLFERVKDAAITTTNLNLEHAGKKPLYEKTDEPTVNEQTHNEIMEELNNDN